MDKFVSFRLEKLSVSGAINQLNHDLRVVAPKYINHSKMKDNKTIYESELLKGVESLKSYNEGQRSRVKEKTGRKAQSNAEFFNAGIMTFSETMTDDYNANPHLFAECSQSFIKALEDKLGLQVLYAQLHLDEKTPHIHLMFDNIDLSSGKGIRRKINPDKLRLAQDLMGDAFEPMGGYKRGRSVEETGAKHLSVNLLHKLGALADELNDEILSMETLIELHKQGNPDLDMLLRMMNNKGHINMTTPKGKQAKQSMINRLQR